MARRRARKSDGGATPGDHRTTAQDAPIEYVIINHAILILIFIALAVSLNLINGFCGMFSLGHHGFWAAGALVSAAVVTKLWPTGADGALLGIDDVSMVVQLGILAVGFAAGTLVSAVLGLVVAIPCLRLEGDYLAIATLCLGEMVWLVGVRIEPTGIHMPSSLTADKLEHHILYLVLAAVLCVGTLVIVRNLIKSSTGRAILAVREDELAASLTGVNVARSKLMVFVVGSAIAGAAGALFAAYYGFVSPKEFTFIKGVFILVIVVLGGSGSITGSVVAAVLLYSTRDILLRQKELVIGRSARIDIGSVTEWWQVIFALVLIVLMLARPAGFFGKKELLETRLWRLCFGPQRAEPDVPVPEGSTAFRQRNVTTAQATGGDAGESKEMPRAHGKPSGD